MTAQTAPDPSTSPPTDGHPSLSLVAIEEFAAVNEPGARGLLGSKADALIAEGSDVLVYGDGGAGKTTLTLDLALHLAAGDEWLGIPIDEPQRVLVVELEGPRPHFREKLACKLTGWSGSAFQGRLDIVEAPWATFTFADERLRRNLAAAVAEHEVDVLLVGPVTRAGMDTAGTLQEVRDFMGLVASLRKEYERSLTVVLVHHEAKNGAVSGAWEGAVDTLFHVESRCPGKTTLRVQKARWSSSHRGQTLRLLWTPTGEGYALEGARDYLFEIRGLLSDGEPRTAKEIATSEDGIGANIDAVKKHLKANPDIFAQHNGAEVGRSPNAMLYGLTPAP
jgi:hypothetical protein